MGSPQGRRSRTNVAYATPFRAFSVGEGGGPRSARWMRLQSVNSSDSPQIAVAHCFPFVPGAAPVNPRKFAMLFFGEPRRPASPCHPPQRTNKGTAQYICLHGYDIKKKSFSICLYQANQGTKLNNRIFEFNIRRL